MRYIDGSYRPLREGVQELWKRAAATFDVVLNADISRISRSADGVEITLPDGPQRFDRLIISCPFDKVAPLMDASEAERQAFQNVQYHPGYRGAFVARGGPTDGVHWYPDTYTQSGGDAAAPGYLTFAVPEAMVTPGVYLYSCMFSVCPTGANAVSTLQASAERMFKEQYGADITEWVRIQYWPYYGPTFDIASARAGAYDRVHALQGQSRTYYTGQLLSIPGNATTVDFSYDLVDSFF